jgi:hypothetical protein
LDSFHYDLTGTIIHANHSIGVIGGSMGAAVSTIYSHFICEMLPPVQAWGKTYYATNYLPSSSTQDNAVYLFIGSEPNQTIFRSECGEKEHVECTIKNQYGVYWDELDTAQKFWSNAPFLLMSYEDSENYTAEVSINPRERFLKSVVVQTPPDLGSNSFGSSANVICNVNAVANTFFDGNSITGYAAQCIDDTFEIVSVPVSSAGAHTLTSDSIVGVYLYGNSSEESYGWSSAAPITIYPSPDSIAPRVDTMSQCYHSFIHVTDSGILPNSLGMQSGLAAIWLDSSNNMRFQPDSNWLEGSCADTSGYAATVIDSSKPGILIVDVSDLAGNLTTITTTYQTHYAGLEPPLRNLGTWTLANPPAISYDTIYNLGSTPYNFDELQLLHGNVGYIIFDSIGGPLDLSPIPVGGRRLIQIQFQALNTASAMDSIIFGTECELNAVAVIGNGGGADFTVSNQTWPNEPLPAPVGGYQETVTISNLSNHPITIDSVWWADTIHFKPVSMLPAPVAASPTISNFTIAYFPDSNSAIAHNSTQGSWFSPQVFESDIKIPQYDTLTGWAAPLAGVRGGNNAVSNAIIIPTNDGQSLEIIAPQSGSSILSFALLNVLGQNVLHTTLGAGSQIMDVSSLPRGVYFYRITSGQMSQSGKVILGE